MINLEQQKKKKKNMFDHIQPNPFSVLHNAWKYLQEDIITNTAAELTMTNQGRWRGNGLEEVSHF